MGGGFAEVLLVEAHTGCFSMSSRRCWMNACSTPIGMKPTAGPDPAVHGPLQCWPLALGRGTAGTHRGLYLTRSGVLAAWPVDDFLALLGACRRDLTFARCSPHCSPAATARPTPGTSPLQRRPSASGGCFSTWPRPPESAVARSASSSCPTPPAGPGSSAPPGAAGAPRSSSAADCCPAARTRCSRHCVARVRSRWCSS